MRNPAIRYLGAAFGVMFASYLALVVFTITLATEQTALASSIKDTQSSIGGLEASYYAAVTRIDSLDAAALGFVEPAHREYARAQSAPILTRAGI